MFILNDSKWSDRYLDTYRLDGECRIDIKFNIVIDNANDIYFIQPYSWRLLLNYLQEVGIIQVLAKVKSRLKEKSRNQKFLTCGLGNIREADSASKYQPGDLVLFIAPCHPECCQRLVLSESLIMPAETQLTSQLLSLGESISVVHHINLSNNIGIIDSNKYLNLKSVVPWSPYSGESIDIESIDRGLAEILPLLNCVPIEKYQKLDNPNTEIECTRIQNQKNSPNKLSGVLFGYGQYAKTNIIPNVKDNIDIIKVHEIDACQIGDPSVFPFDSDTSPVIRNDQTYDVYFIAGYHHTHADIAIQAIQKGSWAVVEKPIVTSWEQFHQLEAILKDSSSRLFACFQKRYSPFNSYIWSDLDVNKGEAINFYCIVYEVPLPAYHWYMWTNSQSRIVSNGCHWIDYFIFLNNFSELKSYNLSKMGNGDIVCTAELANGGCFSMTLTEKGSNRIGLEEHIELRSNARTIRIDNSSEYIAESREKVIRTAKINKLSVYPKMYKEITKKIANNEPGDDWQHLSPSSDLMLKYQDIIDALA
jgi:predicted dehydrogenase